MAVTTLGRLQIRVILPEKYKHFADALITKKLLDKLTTALAKENPDAYVDVLQNLNYIGLQVVSTYGKDTTVTLDDLDSGALLKNARQKLNALISLIINRDDLTAKQKELKIILIGYKYTAKLKDMGVLDAKQRKTGIANQIASGSRGNPVQLMQLVTGDMMMKDAMNRDIPYLATMPYVLGDSLMSYWASAMSGRKSTYDTQAATGKVGYLSKQATNTTHNTPISIRDCLTKTTGLPVKASDPLNIGSVLLRPWKKYPAGTPITLDMIAEADLDLLIIVRSPTTCKAHNGVCAVCSGIQLNGKLPALGSYVALNAVKTYILPLTQAGISCLLLNTEIRMLDNSFIKIKDIQVGALLFGCLKNGETVGSFVTNKFDNGIQPVYKFIFKAKDGLTVLIIATLLHRVLQIKNNTPVVLPLKNCTNICITDVHFPMKESIKVLDLFKKLYFGYKHVYDILIDYPTHLYVLANGIITHNSKHGSGMGGSKLLNPDGDDQPSGFLSVQRMLLAPKNFPGGAILSKVDGRVTEVRKAPQGGSFITVGNSTVYSPIARTVKVKVGDSVLAGDVLTNGVPNPMLIVQYKGIGEGRQYMTNKLMELLPAAGAATARRNLLQFSRAMINKVRITADLGYKGHFPGDIADYDEMVNEWTPRLNSKELKTRDALGTFLLEPALYYSVGTKITPKVVSKLLKYGYDKIITNTNPPPFEPLFISSKAFTQKDSNWLPRLSGLRLTESLFDAARTGITDPYDAASFVNKIIISPINPNVK